MKIANLLWLFQDYRDLASKVAALERTIEDLERQLERRPAQGIEDLIQSYQNETLAEQPFPDGKVPDNLWLTPVDDR